MPQNVDFLQKNVDISKIKEVLVLKLILLKLLLCVYLCRKFQVSSIILSSFRQVEFYSQPPSSSTPYCKMNPLKRLPKQFFGHNSVGWWPPSRTNILTIYYKLGQGCISNWTSFVLLQIGPNVITKWGRRYYKLK